MAQSGHSELTADAIRARLKVIAGLEEEALHVVGRFIVNAEHGEELAVRNGLALPLTGHLVMEMQKRLF